MTFDGYEIRLYRSEFFPQVVDLLKYLLGNDHESNRDYFKWKYDDNPYTEFPLGIMALYKGKVVGFRGYFATRFQIKVKNDKIVSLCPGDTCVHPDHRRKGLSVAMGNRASEEYSGKYPFFLNLSSTKISLPGYLRMRFLPLSSKKYLTRCSMAGLVKFLFNAKKRCHQIAPKVPFGTFDDIIVSQQPRPEEMHILVEGLEVSTDKITLYQDEDFFRWRYANKHNKYIFLFRIKNEVIIGYIVIRVSPNNRRGYIVDYAQGDETSIEKILKFIIKAGFLDVLSIYHFSLTDDIKHKVQDLGFKKVSLFRVIERRIKGELPLLIRPVNHDYSNSDFFVEGLDLRKIENWHIKGICSDDA
jgi:GNAT superfamily N-acetyltransferase